ncbi:carbohydrate porin [Idiomarina aquatica]|uniref:Porin n=1 Tax=Idiomarina aquatica TaxID=1327752 RepID=A0AA94JCC1_9GAMM|nr:carbohydrate porin [Idiomarina aquatica]RUO40334.1 hypothetical protein CWE23_12070 [Idiomarina aquatica]
MEKNYLTKHRQLTLLIGLHGLAMSNAVADDIDLSHSLTVDGHYLNTDDDDAFDWNGLYQFDLSHTLNERLTLNGGAFLATTNHPSAVIGDRQGFSNIESSDPLALTAFNLTYRNDDTRVLVGAFDENSEFAGVNVAGNFLNSSMGYSPTLTHFISYPEAATGLVIDSKLSANASIKAAYLTRELSFGDQQHLNAEFEWQPNAGSRIVAGLSDGHWYGVGETRLVRMEAWDWHGFLQWGDNNRYADFQRHLGMGIVVNSTTNDLSFGLATTAAKTQRDVTEQVWELYARWQVTDSIALQPDVQWITSDHDVVVTGSDYPDDDVAVTMRMVLTW